MVCSCGCGFGITAGSNSMHAHFNLYLRSIDLASVPTGMMELPSGRSVYSYCGNISMEDVHSLVLMRGISGTICFGICLTSLVIEVTSILCQKTGSTVLQRFFVYVIVANLLRAAFLSMAIISHNTADVNENFCEAIGFLSQYFAAFQLLTIVALMLLLLHNLLSLNLDYSFLCSRLFKCNTSYTDVYIIAVLFLLPSLYTWIPFVIEGGIYGDTGPWCWLKAFSSNCSEIGAVFIVANVFWNVPFGIVLLFCCLCVTIYLIFFLYIAFCRKVSHKRVTSVLVDTFFLFLFFAFYTTLCLIELSALMYIHIHNYYDSYPLLVLYAVTLPIGEISLSLASFVHIFHILHNFWKPHRAQLIPYHSIVSKLSDVNVEPSFRVSAKSYTSQQARPAFISPSTDATSLIPETKPSIYT